MITFARNFSCLISRAQSSHLLRFSAITSSHIAPLSRATRCNVFHTSSCFQPIMGSTPSTAFPHRQQFVSFHTSNPTSDKFDIQDEAKKHLRLMLSQVEWKEALNSPQPALAYGAGGLVPFVFPPLAILLNGAFLPNIAFAQLAYGATILAFLGGVRWGYAIPESKALSYQNLGMSVAMPLLGWSSLLLPPWLGTITLMGGIGAATYIDIVSPGFPQWFKALRLCLSTIALGSLALTLLLRMLL